MESLICVNDTEIKELKGAPGLATIAGFDLTSFGNKQDCSTAAGGNHVDAGIIIISPAWVGGALLPDSYPVPIP